eukprot:4866492-Prymnesium_polylepis.2
MRVGAVSRHPSACCRRGCSEHRQAPPRIRDMRVKWAAGEHDGVEDVARRGEDYSGYLRPVAQRVEELDLRHRPLLARFRGRLGLAQRDPACRLTTVPSCMRTKPPSPMKHASADQLEYTRSDGRLKGMLVATQPSFAPAKQSGNSLSGSRSYLLM